jgi:hypothetical protein
LTVRRDSVKTLIAANYLYSCSYGGATDCNNLPVTQSSAARLQVAMTCRPLELQVRSGDWRLMTDNYSSRNALIFRYSVRSPIPSTSAARRRFPLYSRNAASMVARSTSAIVMPGR